MKKISIMLAGLLLLAGSALTAQNSVASGSGKPLKQTIKFFDTDNDGVISDGEAQVILKQYVSNPERKSECDLALEVQSIIIDLIGYLEHVDCETIKNKPSSSQIIELFYKERFASVN